MRRCRIDRPNRCYHLISRVAPRALEFGGLQAANRKGRYDKEKLLWQFTVAIKSDPVGSAKEAQVAVAELQASAQGEGCSGLNADTAYTVNLIQKGLTLLTLTGTFTCKFCGREFRDIRSMTLSSCPKNPERGGHHSPAR